MVAAAVEERALDTKPQVVFCSAGKAGQAIAEMVVALLAIVAITAALLQIGLLGTKQTQTMLNATKQAHHFALADTHDYPYILPRFMQGWEAGQDGVEHSVDDQPLSADSSIIVDDILDVTQPGTLNYYVPGNDFSTTDGDYLLDSSMFVRGHDKENRIPLLPAIRNLMVEQDHIDVETSVYMIWTKGLY